MTQVDQVRLLELHNGLLTLLNDLVILVAASASKYNGFTLTFNGFDLQLSASAVVSGLAFNARSRHLQIETAYERAWTNMQSNGQLSSPWPHDSGCPLRDFVVFITCVRRYRKKTKQASLKGPSGEFLDCLFEGTARFIGFGLDIHVLDNVENFLGKQAPSSRRRWLVIIMDV